ncbi:hypothetical protein L873DRAFT_537536 [Choiromyces venosus 120613-1]|uniref:Uncharacterized protein n=1 Tax=Choiromyces venosus 120613-1 TaxID=1336337 RepID=A0A3N4K8G5_9PEZI|nr:hypothetical protein L873DRAFT_537536 [Choiromyces venosus 120613-1]
MHLYHLPMQPSFFFSPCLFVTCFFRVCTLLYSTLLHLLLLVYRIDRSCLVSFQILFFFLSATNSKLRIFLVILRCRAIEMLFELLSVELVFGWLAGKCNGKERKRGISAGCLAGRLEFMHFVHDISAQVSRFYCNNANDMAWGGIGREVS